jgi:ABC-type glycerol-3-phosphate transport system substrate-binding protein
LLSVLTLALFIGYGTVMADDAPIPEKPDKLTLLSVANSTGLWDYVSEWENATGIKVEITEMDLPSLQTQATTYFAAQSDEIDLLYSYIALTAEWSSAGYLENIRDYLTEEEWSKFSIGALDCVSYKDGIFGLPYFYSIRLFYSNMDILNEYGFDSPPTTWDEFVEIAKATTDPSKDQYGVLMGLGTNDACILSYQDICALYGQTLVSADDEILFTNENGVAALENFVALQSSGVLDPASFGVVSGNERRARFLTGKDAMAWEWAGLMPMIEAQGTFKAKLSLTPAIKSSGAITGSEGIVVSKYSNNKYWAMDLLKYLTSDEVQTRYAKTSGWFPVKNTVFDDPNVLGLSTAMIAAKEQTGYPTFRWAAPYYSEAITVLGTQVFDALKGSTTPKDALDSAAAEIEGIIESYK